jgi:hypothetical protein
MGHKMKIIMQAFVMIKDSTNNCMVAGLCKSTLFGKRQDCWFSVNLEWIRKDEVRAFREHSTFYLIFINVEMHQIALRTYILLIPLLGAYAWYLHHQRHAYAAEYARHAEILEECSKFIGYSNNRIYTNIERTLEQNKPDFIVDSIHDIGKMIMDSSEAYQKSIHEKFMNAFPEQRPLVLALDRIRIW